MEYYRLQDMLLVVLQLTVIQSMQELQLLGKQQQLLIWTSFRNTED
jgi:hypothetical protein